MSVHNRWTGRTVLLIIALLLAGSGGVTRTPSQSAPASTGSSSTSPAKTKKVLLIGLDGIRVDILAKALTPHIDKLIANGTFSDEAKTRMPTVSGPGWSSMLTGVWSDKHGVKDNSFAGKNYTTYPDFLTRLEQVNPDFSTFSATDWPPLGSSIQGGPLISDSIDVKMLFNGDTMGYAEADAQTVAAAAYYLANEDPDAAFVYIGNTDVVGHQEGSLSPEYLAEIEKADTYVGRLVAAVQSRPTYAEEDWLILMSTDHGRTDNGGHGGPSEQERTIFFLASGPSAQQSPPERPPAIVDVAVTALAHLGVEIDPAWKLDGQVVGIER